MGKSPNLPLVRMYNPMTQPLDNLSFLGDKSYCESIKYQSISRMPRCLQIVAFLFSLNGEKILEITVFAVRVANVLF